MLCFSPHDACTAVCFKKLPGMYLDRQRYTVFWPYTICRPNTKTKINRTSGQTHTQSVFFFLHVAIRNSLRSNKNERLGIRSHNKRPNEGKSARSEGVYSRHEARCPETRLRTSYVLRSTYSYVHVSYVRRGKREEGIFWETKDITIDFNFSKQRNERRYDSITAVVANTHAVAIYAGSAVYIYD